MKPETMRSSKGRPSLIERAAERLAEEPPRPEPATAPDTENRPAAAEKESPKVKIDFDRLAESGHLTPNQMRSHLAEQVRLIKRSVLQTLAQEDVERGNLIMVASACPGEGKSFTALNLAISLACDVDYHVLLVDADFERPAVLDRLGVRDRPGLMDVLTDRSADLSEIIFRTNLERLSVIGPGRPDDMSPELLGGQRMRELTKEMADRYSDRLIVFDTPPLLSSTAPAMLAEHLGQVVYIVEADVTPREMIEQALERLPPNCAVNMVLNKGRASLGSNKYSYYGYRAYHSSSSRG